MMRSNLSRDSGGPKIMLIALTDHNLNNLMSSVQEANSGKDKIQNLIKEFPHLAPEHL